LRDPQLGPGAMVLGRAIDLDLEEPQSGRLVGGRSGLLARALGEQPVDDRGWIFYRLAAGRALRGGRRAGRLEGAPLRGLRGLRRANGGR
jgi:hypothetical protein